MMFSHFCSADICTVFLFKTLFYKEEPETIEHLLWGCHQVSDLWHGLNRWIFQLTYIEIPLNLEIVMFGLLHPYEANLIKNKIIKKCVFLKSDFLLSNSLMLQC
jgi:hypothetical protein